VTNRQTHTHMHTQTTLLQYACELVKVFVYETFTDKVIEYFIF